MTRHAPRPTLFPYTTLFRSIRQAIANRDDARNAFKRADQLHGRGLMSQVDYDTSETRLKVAEANYQAAIDGVRSLKASLQEDRKSTRLNSSHTVISYAVFCLNDPPRTATYPLSLHDALPIYPAGDREPRRCAQRVQARRSAARARPDVAGRLRHLGNAPEGRGGELPGGDRRRPQPQSEPPGRSEEHTSELQSHSDLVCRLLLE